MRALSVFVGCFIASQSLAQISQVDPATLTTNIEETFESAPTSETLELDLHGVSIAEKFSGQTQSDLYFTNGGCSENPPFDDISGSPSSGLALSPGAGPGLSVKVVTQGSSKVINGLCSGVGGQGQGEGSMSFLFDEDQSEVGLKLSGCNGGTATLVFYDRAGDLIDTISLALSGSPPASGTVQRVEYAFRRDGSVVDIAGLLITNLDCAGIGLDDLRFSLTTGACCWSCDEYPGGSSVGCVELVRNDCCAANGLYAGDGTTCATSPCDEMCPGDIDGDGETSVFDAGILAGNWGHTDAPGRCGGDLNCDGNVDAFDFAILSSGFPCDGTIVPEQCCSTE